MFYQNKKHIEWKKKNYVWSILHFALHWLFLSLIAAFALYINFGFTKAIDFITGDQTYLKCIFAVIAMLLMCFVVYLYLYFECRDYLIKGKNIAVFFFVIELSMIICLVMGRYVGIFARPSALCALLILLLVNKRTATFANFIFNILMLLTDILVAKDGVSIQVIGQFVTGLSISHLAVYLVDNVGSRIKVFGMGFIISLPIVAMGFVFHLDQSINIYEALEIVLHGFMSGIISVVALMAILPIFEYLFNVLTNYRLAEITDHKSKLIKAMITEASGTFQHSIVVATLAETCATAIGENPLLARAAAYYHDMGKLKQPIYFTENQHGYNPHDELTPELSTQIIRAHAKDGSDLIKKYHLPTILADVAIEHHGTLPIQYFYAKAQKFTDGELDIKDYSYPGPKPSSKIAAIIMLADGGEAAVRAQKDRTPERVEAVIKAIIDDRMKLDQFSNCEITMREIELIKEALVYGLSDVYHSRVQYPNKKDRTRNLFASSKENKNAKD
ncbi:MAG: HDIG domain-containing protein [Clostridia bacterium]|nr:HDIG domain-containing protein [Clostridia bacterium]